MENLGLVEQFAFTRFSTKPSFHCIARESKVKQVKLKLKQNNLERVLAFYDFISSFMAMVPRLLSSKVVPPVK